VRSICDNNHRPHSDWVRDTACNTDCDCDTDYDTDSRTKSPGGQQQSGTISLVKAQ
jgi:hypothetical protein